MFLSVDRIEHKTAVCETPTGQIVRLPLKQLPDGVREGSVLRQENGVYALDREEEARRRKAALELQRMLFDEE